MRRCFFCSSDNDCSRVSTAIPITRTNDARPFSPDWPKVRFDVGHSSFGETYGDGVAEMSKEIENVFGKSSMFRSPGPSKACDARSFHRTFTPRPFRYRMNPRCTAIIPIRANEIDRSRSTIPSFDRRG